MNHHSGLQFWKDIVRLTDESGSDSVRSLRAALFIWMQMDKPNLLRRQGRQLFSACRTCLPLSAVPIPRAQRGRLVFCFAHRSPANMNNLLPVAREADRRGLLGGIVSAGDFSAELKEFSGRVPVVTAQSLVGLISGRERQRIMAEAFRTLNRVINMFSNFDSRLTARVKKNFGTLLAETNRSLQMAKVFRILLDTWAPSCVVSTSDLWPLEFQFAAQASALQIPSVVIQHGLQDDSWWPFQADLFVAWGQIFKEKMEELGAPPNRLAVGGMPGSDPVFRDQQRVADADRGLASVQNPPVCLILSHSHGRVVEPEIFKRFQQTLSETVRLTPNLRWKVKLHPAEDDSFYRELGDDIFRRLEIYPKSTSLSSAISQSDVVTTVFSASGLEAMMMERPVIVPLLSSRVRELAWWPDLGGGVYVRSPEEFCARLTSLVSDSQDRLLLLGAQRNFIRGSFAFPGHGAEAIVELISNSQVLDAARGVLSGGAVS